MLKLRIRSNNFNILVIIYNILRWSVEYAMFCLSQHRNVIIRITNCYNLKVQVLQGFHNLFLCFGLTQIKIGDISVLIYCEVVAEQNRPAYFLKKGIGKFPEGI